MNWFKSLFAKRIKQPEDSMKKYLIAGLGNIGAEYVNTRHNIGFKILDRLAGQENADFKTAKLGTVAELKIKGRTVFLLKPNTYMNLSGKAVKYWLEQEKIPIENLLVVTDDLNLSFGTIRIKGKGSDGGHNGLKSIQQLLNTSDYPRFRFGISDAFKKGQQVNYVLGEWDEEEKATLPERLDVSAEAIKSFVLSGIANTMSSFNGK
ncbi:aminoacyl-tRNA hydrolase [Flavobacterium sp. MK4S-17]|jgi:PTH1 family peptidyl-tRNA hydrolase|uniref:aminoacyl-tRNA hydrolase n=1 Tax=Flavobacterium sp. MK4S-17 TaxID=2543737 RepID=UPI0019165832